MSKRTLAALAAWVWLTPQLGHAQSEPAFETPHSIPLSDVVPESMQKGPGYSLSDSAFANGFSLDYVLMTEEFGAFTPSSDYLLDVRIGEVRALQELAEMRKSKAYAIAVGKAGAAPLYLVKDLATRPIATVTAVPKGIWRAGTKAVKWLGGDRRPRADSENSATREVIGVSGRKRALAAKLHVDPYTTNMKLQDELDRVSWASFAGGLSVTLAMAAVAIPPAATMTYRISNLAKSTNELVTSVSGGDLYRMNRTTLQVIGLSEEETAAFLDNPHLSPSRKAAITLALESLDGASGSAHVVALGAAIENEDDAVRLQLTTELMSAFHLNSARVVAILRWDNHLFVKERDGNTIAIVPADHLLWNEQSRSLADAMRVASGPDAKLAIWTTGVFSETVRTALSQRGIALRDRIEF